MTDIDKIFPTRLNFPVARATMMIEVDARRPGWDHSNTGCNWCTAKQYTNNVKVTASANNTSKARSTSMIIISGDDMDDVEDITIEQSCKFNALNLILPQKQEDPTGCAVTCVAMCICQTQAQLKKDGFAINYVESWYNLAETYGYTWTELSSPSLKKVYDLLKEGYPVIVQVRADGGSINPHWVTVYQYTGNSTTGNNLNVADFMCADPYYGDLRKFNTAANFNSSHPINRIVVYKQKVC